MKTKLFITVLLAVGLFGSSRAGIDIGISADESGIKDFYLAIGDHYKQPEKEIIVVRERGIPDEELPVVFYLASRRFITRTWAAAIPAPLSSCSRISLMTWIFRF